MNAMAIVEMWTPQKAKEASLAKAQDSTFSLLVIQDHTDSLGKPILLKGDEVLLNELVAHNA